MPLPSAYLPPISWFANLITDQLVMIEAHEHYQKQTIRNRCIIDSPNGPLALTIPVDKTNFVAGKCAMCDVRISTHSEWQRQHWYALESSYYNSPFFEYLQDDFRPLYEQHWTYLMDFNEALINRCCEIIDIKPTIARTEQYVGVDMPYQRKTESSNNRTTVQPNNRTTAQPHNRTTVQPNNRTTVQPNNRTTVQPYYQVFSQKHGFQPDLSVIDLIFNMGPEALIYLTQLARQ